MFTPKISIVIPVYNGSNFLGEAINSALAQTYQNTEIIVVNDGSTDNGETEKIALSYGDKIKYFYKPNGGAASAVNYGIEKMTGEYFSWLSHDDLYYPQKIEEQIKYLNSIDNKQIIVFSDFEFVDEKGNFLYKSNIPSLTTENIVYKTLISFPINGCTLLIPKTAFEKVGVLNEKLETIQDYDMWFRLMREFKFYYINKVLVKNRRHGKQDSNNKILTCIRGKSRLNKKVLNNFSIEEIKNSSGSKLPNFLFKYYLKFRLNLLQSVSYLSLITRKLKIHTILVPLARKIMFK